MEENSVDNGENAPSGRRIVMLVDNGVHGDSRVQKAARSAAAAGWDADLQDAIPVGRSATIADGEWTVAANQGSKSLAKPYVIKAGEALKMVAMLDVPGVHEAVEEIVSAARAEAESQAERLRAELADVLGGRAPAWDDVRALRDAGARVIGALVVAATPPPVHRRGSTVPGGPVPEPDDQIAIGSRR